MLYNIYDRISGINICENTNNNNVHQINNIITVNEYCVFDMKDKNKTKTLKNTIYYIPEIFKISN